MLVGAGRIVLDFFGNQNAAVKRREMDALCAELRKKFNLSALEVADFEDNERCVLGFAAVIPETWKLQSARSLMEKICETIDQTAFARVTVEDWDILSHGDERPIIDEDYDPSEDKDATEASRIIRKKLGSRSGSGSGESSGPSGNAK